MPKKPPIVIADETVAYTGSGTTAFVDCGPTKPGKQSRLPPIGTIYVGSEVISDDVANQAFAAMRKDFLEHPERWPVLGSKPKKRKSKKRKSKKRKSKRRR